jgi:hypothetical protein
MGHRDVQPTFSLADIEKAMWDATRQNMHIAKAANSTKKAGSSSRKLEAL